MCCSQILGNDQLDTLAERLLGRIAKQHGRGVVPANDRSRAVFTDNGVRELIENSFGQFRLIFHGVRSRFTGEYASRALSAPRSASHVESFHVTVRHARPLPTNKMAAIIRHSSLWLRIILLSW